jgi:ABC-type transport system substrate-binding protein
VLPNGVKKVDDYTVAFNLDGSSSILLKAITLYVPGIFDSKVAKAQAAADDPFATKWLLKNTAGFGPYHMSELKPGEQALFTVNPNYFGKKLYFDRVVYRMVPSGANRLTLLKAGQVHMAENMTAQQLSELEKDRNVKVEYLPGRGVAAVRMNSSIKPFDDVRVRQAFNYATDKRTLISTVFAGKGEAARSFVATLIDGGLAGPEPYPYDPERAKKLLSDAGHPNGVDVELAFSDIYEWEEPTAIQMQSMLRASNIRLTPKRITGLDMRNRSAINVQDIPFFTYEDGPIVLDATYAAYLIAHSKGGVSNRTKYANAEVDGLINSARTELDRDKRNALMRRAQEIWVREAPWILTTFRAVGEAYTPRLKGFVAHPDDHERWIDLSF